jgi:hypothetical protein
MASVVAVEGPDVFQIRDFAAGGRRLPLGNMSFAKRTLA